MRILACSNHHRYPARRFPVSNGGLAGSRVLDAIVKGLAELGHEVLYCLPKGAVEPLPAGVTMVSDFVRGVDVVHHQNNDLVDDLDITGLPWVRTCHTDLAGRGQDRSHAKWNWIFVSRTLASTYGSDRFVINGIDPSEYAYSETKSDYLLFMGDLARAKHKGLDIALALCRRIGFRLVIAGSAAKQEAIDEMRHLCAGLDVRLVGEVMGSQKAELLAGARALLFPTRINEAFGLVMAEALMSGTPVICSDRGACAELISPEVGFVCGSEEEYIGAFAYLDRISPRACREKAMRNYHYLRMAADYVREYAVELGRVGA